MSTAVDDIALEETPVTEVTFSSGCNNLALVMEASRAIQVGQTQQFEPTQGRYIKFTEGVYKTSEADELEFLRAHPGYGLQFVELGFGEDGLPNADTGKLVSDVISLAYNGQLDKIADILYAELNGGMQRTIVIQACEAALNGASATAGPTRGVTTAPPTGAV